MLRCITEDNKSLIATTCEPASTRNLSREHKLLCPNCRAEVRYNKGNVRNPYFSHVNLDCEYPGSEPETADHIKGKILLHNWLTTRYPTAFVEYEVHVPETGQIMDVCVRHEDGDLAGLVWAFEFQHSKISSSTWKERHDMYVSAGIQDFWILDKAKFMKFSSSKSASANARLQKDLDKAVFDETGLCYFLDLDTSELTIDFHFRTETVYVDIGRPKRVKHEFTYHDPEKHTAHLDNVKVRCNSKFRYGVMVSEAFEKHMELRLTYILHKLEQAEEAKIRQEFWNRARELVKFAQENYGEDFTDRLKEIIRSNTEDENEDEVLRSDVLSNDSVDFFTRKYKSIVETSIANLKTYNSLKLSTQLVPRYLLSKVYTSDFNRLKYLAEQGIRSLEEHLTVKYQDQIALVQYVYDKHKSVLDTLAARRKERVNEKLGEIKWNLKTYAKEPDAIDYAIPYGELKSIEEVDSYIQQIEEKIINYKPTLDWDDDDL